MLITIYICGYLFYGISLFGFLEVAEGVITDTLYWRTERS